MFIMFYLPDVWKHIISDNSDSNVFQLIDYKIDLIALCILGIAIYLSVIAIYIISMNARNLHKMNCMFEIINERFNKLEEICPKKLEDLTFEEYDTLWKKAKELTSNQGK